MISQARFFRRAGDGPPGDARAHGRERVDALAEMALDRWRRDGRPAGSAPAARALVTVTLPYSQMRPRSLRSRSVIMMSSASSFGIGLELEGKLLVAQRVAIARAGALDRPSRDVAPADAQEEFRRSGENARVAEIEERPARRRAAREQVLEEAVGDCPRKRRGEFLREVDLVDVASGDVFLCARHAGLVIATPLVGLPDNRTKVVVILVGAERSRRIRHASAFRSILGCRIAAEP